MDDLTSKISSLLNDPETMEQLKGLAGLLGQPSPEESAQPKEPEKANTDSGGSDNTASDGFPFPTDMLQMAMKAMPIINALKTEDEGTKLLKCLRPFLSPPRQKKVDEAIKILQIMRVIPMLKDGFFDLF